MTKRQRVIALVTAAIFVPVMFVSIVTWPMLYVSRSYELFGTQVDMEQLSHFTTGGREGFRATIYRLSSPDSETLDIDRQRLAKYPMWSGRAFDGYQRVRWQTLAELSRGTSDKLVQSVFDDPPTAIELEDVKTLRDAQNLAAAMSRNKGVLVGGWYAAHGSSITNYCVYVLNLEQQLMIQLTLLT